jgi:hypothetical protein
MPWLRFYLQLCTNIKILKKYNITYVFGNKITPWRTSIKWIMKTTTGMAMKIVMILMVELRHRGMDGVLSLAAAV